MKLSSMFFSAIQNRINKKNRSRLKNFNPTIISSNCTGGFLYHWLGLRFNSPFINLFLKSDGFIDLLERWETIKKVELKECKELNLPYPVGNLEGIKIYFMHYSSFEEAKKKWQERMLRIDENNLCVMFTNWDGNIEYAKRFDSLPFKNKVLFSDRKLPGIKSSFYIKKWNKNKGLHRTYSLLGKRYIDQFDYVSFFNSIIKK